MRATRRIIGLGLVLGLAASPSCWTEAAGKEAGWEASRRRPLFRRSVLSRLPGPVFRSNPAARHRARTVPSVSTSPNSIRFTITSTTPNSRSATSSSTTACTTALGAPSRAVLEGAVDEAVRNEAAFRLARIHFQKDQLDDALQALGGSRVRCPQR